VLRNTGKIPYFNFAGSVRQPGYFLFKAKKKVSKEMAQSRLPPSLDFRQSYRPETDYATNLNFRRFVGLLRTAGGSHVLAVSCCRYRRCWIAF
jgi:hypothetical protein